jgi:hypothetical protein
MGMTDQQPSFALPTGCRALAPLFGMPEKSNMSPNGRTATTQPKITVASELLI